MAEIRIEDSIPENDPRRHEIEGVLRETLRDLVGTWTAAIRPAQTNPWWLVVLERTDGAFKATLLLDPREESPAAIREAILVSLKGAV